MDSVKVIADKIAKNIGAVIKGKDDVVRKTVIALLTGGHILLEDVPGSGKTMLAKTLAASVDGTFKRIQMTPDMLPADITGVNIFDLKTSQFRFVKGPVFTNILIADEINRATPKTQAGLLECMEEEQVTVDGNTWPMEDVFMVIATQNPVDTQGVFPLPEDAGGSFPDEIIYGISGSRQYDRNFPDTYTKRCTGAGHTGNFHRRDKKCRKADRTGKHQ